MVTLRRGILHHISQVMNSMKWLRMSLLSFGKQKRTIKNIEEDDMWKKQLIFLGATILEGHRRPSFN
jgi:prefoldin subunit 5